MTVTVHLPGTADEERVYRVPDQGWADRVSLLFEHTGIDSPVYSRHVVDALHDMQTQLDARQPLQALDHLEAAEDAGRRADGLPVLRRNIKLS